MLDDITYDPILLQELSTGSFYYAPVDISFDIAPNTELVYSAPAGVSETVTIYIF